MLKKHIRRGDVFSNIISELNMGANKIIATRYPYNETDMYVQIMNEDMALSGVKFTVKPIEYKMLLNVEAPLEREPEDYGFKI